MDEMDGLAGSKSEKKRKAEMVISDEEDERIDVSALRARPSLPVLCGTVSTKLQERRIVHTDSMIGLLTTYYYVTCLFACYHPPNTSISPGHHSDISQILQSSSSTGTVQEEEDRSVAFYVVPGSRFSARKGRGEEGVGCTYSARSWGH
jgi:hypothetical protein